MGSSRWESYGTPGGSGERVPCSESQRVYEKPSNNLVWESFGTPGGSGQYVGRGSSQEDERATLARINRENRVARDEHEISDIVHSGCSIFGSRVWDGGRMACRGSDVDVLLGKMPGQELRNIPDLVSRFKLLSNWLATSGLSHDRVNFVQGPNHWALTGREEKQIFYISGPMPKFIPAPSNAESSMIRRSAMKIMGISLCEGGPEVDLGHELRKMPAIMNAFQWVATRALAWEDESLKDLAHRIRNALALGTDLREVL